MLRSRSQTCQAAPLERIVKNLKYFVSRSSKSVFEKLDINLVILIQLRSAARTCGPCRKQRIPAAIQGKWAHSRIVQRRLRGAWSRLWLPKPPRNNSSDTSIKTNGFKFLCIKYFLKIRGRG